MADKRTVAKRNGQVKLLQAMITKGQGIMADLGSSRNPKKELAALLKNIQTKKLSIDELNENILNSIEPKEIEEEMDKSSVVDLTTDTEIEILSEFLQQMDCGAKEDERPELFQRRSRDASPFSELERERDRDRDVDTRRQASQTVLKS